MSSLSPPSQRIWWNQPVDRVEGTWIVVALVWSLILFFMMPYWHVFGKQNYKGEAYRTTPAAYSVKVQNMIDAHTVRHVTDHMIPVVRPPAGSDVYLAARLWQFYPALELVKGQTYRLHFSSMDWQHGFSLQPLNINMQVLPGYETVITITPDSSGEFTIVCNEYCGIMHHTMLGKIYVVDR